MLIMIMTPMIMMITMIIMSEEKNKKDNYKICI